eukprot:TRINITY_DN469_c1_g1_i2.p1 TRINITY_DN469_c1_g1~~TRINITY_DN469_c1_g1_i2.p1  ORF type:complete len:324 (-),score=81.22 TRINITY_DN469_c1_g1_i2:7-978(-)
MGDVEVFGSTYDPRADVEALGHALTRIGTDDNALIKILGGKNPSQMAALRDCWLQVHGTSLVHSLEKDTSFNFKTALHYLVDPLPECQADYLWDAMDGIGTKDTALIDILTQCTNEEMEEIKHTYAVKYHGKKKSKKDHGHPEDALAHDVADEVSGNFERVLLECIKGTREEGPVNDEEAAKDAEELYKAGEKRWVTDDNVFIGIITRRSPAHLMAVDRHYTQHQKHPLIDAIKSKTSGHYGDALVALATPRARYVAQRLYHSMKGLGTNDLVLIYHLCSTYPLQPVKDEYLSLYGKTLEHDIAGDTSGDYKHLLLEIARARA